MSLNEVTYEAFLGAVSDILAKDQDISVKKIMARTGCTYKTILRYLAHYFDDQLDQAAKPPVPTELAAAFHYAIQRQGEVLNQEIERQLVMQTRVIKEVQEINAEFLDRCEQKDRQLFEVRAICDRRLKQIIAERAAAARVEDELEKKLDEVSAQCASARKEMIEVKIEKARLVAKLEQEVAASCEMANRCITLDNELKGAKGDLHQQQVISAAARAEALAGEDHVMSLHAILAQRDREVSESQERLLRALSNRKTTEVQPTKRSSSPGRKAGPKGPKTSRPLEK